MLNLIIPTEKNNYKAYLLKTPVLIVFLLLIFLFNASVKIDVKAQSNDTAITSESLLRGHNLKRAENNMPSLKISSLLARSALAKAEVMLETNCWSHYCPDGTAPWHYFDEAGYEYLVAGENLAEGYYNVDDVMNAWMNSKTHRDNILKKDFREIGFGILYGNYQGMEGNIIIVVHFGASPEDIVSSGQSSISIFEPQNNEIIGINSLNVKGSVENINTVDLYMDGALIGNADVDQGLFTYKLENIETGVHELTAQGNLDYGLTKESNIISFEYKPETNLTEISQSSGISITGSDKNIINLGFIIGLGVLFLIDFIILSRTQMLVSNRSFSHYHLGIFVIIGLVVMAGGFTGSLI